MGKRGVNHGCGFLACGRKFVRKPKVKFPGEEGDFGNGPVRKEENCPDARAYGYHDPMPIGMALSCLSGWGEEVIDEKSRQLGRLREEQGFVTSEDLEDGEQIGSSINEEEEETASQEEREEERHNPKAMLIAAKGLLRMLYGIADDSISIFEFEGITKMNSIIVLYLRERMDGIVKHFFCNLHDEYVVENVLEFVQKMSPYQTAISGEEVNHILPHARIEMHEQNAIIKRIRETKISAQAKTRLIQRAQIEYQKPGYHGNNSNNNCHAFRLGQMLFGKDKFGRMLRAK